MFYSKIVTENDELSAIHQFVNKNALVQHSIKLKDIYKHMNQFDYKYIVCFSESNKVVGVFPFIHFKGAFGDIIHSTPYIGYGGGCSQSFDYLKSMVAELMAYARKHGILLVTICTSPFSKDYSQYKKIFKPDFVQENFYQYINLENDYLKEMTSKNRNNLKRNLRIAEENGVYLKEDYSESSLFNWYKNVYVPRLEETRGAIYPFEVFNELRKEFGKERLLIQYAMIEDMIIGAGLFLKQQKSIDNFMRVIGSEYQRTNAGVMLDYWSIQFAKEHGFAFYNWQSCDRIDSPIFKYKKTWGSKVNSHYYITKITNSIKTLKEVSLSDIKKEYNGVYILPYSEFEK